MPLRDHFHPPLHPHRHWHSFHHTWATFLAVDLNHQLPPGYYAEPNIQFGIEIDVGTFESRERPAEPTTFLPWKPPDPALTAPITIVTDLVEVRVYEGAGGFELAAAIELVSPANKDRPASRDAFVSKCASYIQQGIGLIVVDIVTERQANLHDGLLARLDVPAAPLGTTLYAAAYHPVQRDDQPHLDVWQEKLTLGALLPTLPMWLRGGICLPVNLETTYDHTCRELRITANGVS